MTVIPQPTETFWNSKLEMLIEQILKEQKSTSNQSHPHICEWKKL